MLCWIIYLRYIFIIYVCVLMYRVYRNLKIPWKSCVMILCKCLVLKRDFFDGCLHSYLCE
ncbi:Hypothetical protein ERGA_CDS_06900 [Ehrlichia ruminantium str. Gardel]|nr:Hypothetical protein ERGA_CDS_06900 [Ehrlichia ruminantium str. Gardel]